jgi:hypothetical protein
MIEQAAMSMQHHCIGIALFVVLMHDLLRSQLPSEEYVFQLREGACSDPDCVYKLCRMSTHIHTCMLGMKFVVYSYACMFTHIHKHTHMYAYSIQLKLAIGGHVVDQ